MSISLYAAFVAASTILMLIPGPNVALIVANSIALGGRLILSSYRLVFNRQPPIPPVPCSAAAPALTPTTNQT